MDPFPPTCDPAAYVPRAATDRVLDALETGFRAGRRVTALSGPGGLGKTMVLRVLETRLADHSRCLHLPYAALTTDDLVSWVLGLSGKEPCVLDPEGALYRLAKAGPPLVLLLDDASAMPPETARDLVSWAEGFGGALRIVVVPVDDDRAGRVLGALGEGVLDLRLCEPMSEDETRSYLAARIDALPEPKDVMEQLTNDRIAWLCRESSGNPRVLHGLVSWLLYADTLAPGSPRGWAEPWLDTGNAADDPTQGAPLEPVVAAAIREASRATASEGYSRRRRRRRR